jgi:adenosylcobinamide-GDP ribazoletransferase
MEKNDPLRQLWLAAVLLTRVPLPHLPQTAFAHGARAVWAYPVVGFAVGLAGAAVGQSALAVGLPVFAAAMLGLAAMMLLTGAMHEDGLADVFDGFWGGYTPARRLEIMRDSQIGTYGVLALGGVSLLRVSAMGAVLSEGSWIVLPMAAAASRAVMPVLMAALPLARKDGLSHSVGKPVRAVVAIGAVGAAAAAVGMLGAVGAAALVAVTAVAACVALLARAKIGGQTGDVLGAAQQLSEVAFLLTCAALLGS